ncbi:MAG: hypothetical protein AABX90_01310 [Nanoarchaeota archaeon]
MEVINMKTEIKPRIYLVKDEKGPLTLEADLEVARTIANEGTNRELWYVTNSRAKYEAAVELRRTVLDPLREQYHLN